MNKYQFAGYIFPPDIINFRDFELTSDYLGQDSSISGEIKLSIHINSVMLL